MVPYAGMDRETGRRVGVKAGYERHAIADLGVPSNPADMAGILGAIDAALDDGKNVFVHCWGGVGRTGTVVGCWLVRHGRTGDEALAQIAEWLQGMEKKDRHPRSPETVEQREYVRRWETCARRNHDG